MTIEQLNGADPDTFVRTLAPLFEGAPNLVRRLVDAGPFETEEHLFDVARAIAREMPEDEQVELLNAHPRIGADPRTVSAMSRREQGYDDEVADDQAWIDDELRALNEAYEARFGFRFVIFVAGRPRADIVPLLERALRADREEELRRGVDDALLIAADRMGTLRGPQPMREEQREMVALAVSRHMVGELDRDGLVRSTHRLIEEGVESPGLLALALANEHHEPDLQPAIGRLLAEIGLEGWDAAQAAQLLALHAAASILGDVSHPIDGARRIANVSGNAEFEGLVARWEADPERRPAVDAEIRRAAADLFGPPDEHGEAA